MSEMNITNVIDSDKNDEKYHVSMYMTFKSPDDRDEWIRRRVFEDGILPQGGLIKAYSDEDESVFYSALKSIADGDGCYGLQASEYKQIARKAIAKAEGGHE